MEKIDWDTIWKKYMKTYRVDTGIRNHICGQDREVIKKLVEAELRKVGKIVVKRGDK